MSSSAGSSSNPSGKVVEDGIFSPSSSPSSSTGDEASETASGTSGIVSSVASRESGFVVEGSRREKERAPRNEGRSGEADRIDEPAEAVCSGTRPEKGIL